MNYFVGNLRYFEKPNGIDIYAEIFHEDDKVGWLEQAAYEAPHVYFYSRELQEKFEAETGQSYFDANWENFIENMIRDCERKFYGPEEYDRLLKEVLNG